jgi:hypothetical protein
LLVCFLIIVDRKEVVMSLMGFYALRNEETEEEYTLDADDFIWEDANQSGEQYRFIHAETEDLPEVVATFDIDEDEFFMQMPAGYEELEDGLYLNTGGDDYDADAEYGYDDGYDD